MPRPCRAGESVAPSILCGIAIQPPQPQSNRKTYIIAVVIGVLTSLLSTAILSLAKVIGKLSVDEIIFYIGVPGATITLVVGGVMMIRQAERFRANLATWQLKIMRVLSDQAATIGYQNELIDGLLKRVATLEPPSPAEKAALEAFMRRQESLSKQEKGS